jgi:undecaprenyl diphosphate synthase
LFFLEGSFEMQSRLVFKGLHVAIIMDGNGRWAQSRGQPRLEGHRAGASAVRRVVEAAPAAGVGTLTLYAFSADNWRRPPAEVDHLMALFERYLDEELQRCRENGVRLSVIGRRDRLRPALVQAVERAEAVTASGRRLHLRLAVDYSARQALVQAAAATPRGPLLGREAFAEVLNRITGSRPAAPDVDLLIRTGGEQRLSDFLLWECAYAELLFLDRAWPDFDAGDLQAAVAAFRRRNRRFGAVPRAAQEGS